jgi:hypothetical protein
MSDSQHPLYQRGFRAGRTSLQIDLDDDEVASAASEQID